MSAIEVTVMRRPERRTHLILAGTPMCGTRTTLTDAVHTALPLAGGPTKRLRNDLERELDGNACIPCTRIALAILALYVARDTGRPL